jgi:hypothetical protein
VKEKLVGQFPLSGCRVHIITDIGTVDHTERMAAEEQHDHPHDLERYPPPEEISLNAHCRWESASCS